MKSTVPALASNRHDDTAHELLMTLLLSSNLLHGLYLLLYLFGRIHGAGRESYSRASMLELQ